MWAKRLILIVALLTALGCLLIYWGDNATTDKIIDLKGENMTENETIVTDDNVIACDVDNDEEETWWIPSEDFEEIDDEPTEEEEDSINALFGGLSD